MKCIIVVLHIILIVLLFVFQHFGLDGLLTGCIVLTLISEYFLFDYYKKKKITMEKILLDKDEKDVPNKDS